MKILNISLDTKVLDQNSAVAKRIAEYEKIVDKYTVVVSDNKRGRLGNFLKIFFAARQILKQESYDIITVQDAYFIGWLAAKLAKKFKIALEVQVHGFEKFRGIRKLLAKKILQKADAVRVVSRRLKREVMDEFGVAEGKITVVPIQAKIQNPKSEIQNKSKIKNSNIQNDGHFVFLTVGRLVPVKNIEMQIEALAEVSKTYPQTELWIVGDGTQRKTLEVKCQMSNVKCQFMGWQADLEQYYGQADVFLLTSNSEGWGLSVVEAAAHGLPIIMTDVGLAGEVIKDGESGIVIPVGGQKSLENAMIKLIEDENLRKTLGEGARQAVKTLPSKEETLQLYKQSWQKANVEYLRHSHSSESF